MPRIAPLEPANAQPAAQALLDNVNKALGVTPNMMKTLAHSPAALEAYLGFGQTLGKGTLGGKLGEQIALAVAGVNACGYCASAHTIIGGKHGISEDEAKSNINGDSSDPKVQAALDFARTLVIKRGWATDADLKNVRDAGFSDGEIAEIIGHVALNTFTNYFNHVADPEVDFPKAEVGEPVFA